MHCMFVYVDKIFLFYDVAFIKFTIWLITISHKKYSTYGNENDRHLFMGQFPSLWLRALLVRSKCTNWKTDSRLHL